jgi:hypothetical protein
MGSRLPRRFRPPTFPNVGAAGVLALAAVLLAVLPAACSDQGDHPRVTVVNNSPVEVTVSYHFTVSGRDQALPVEVTVRPGQRTEFYLTSAEGCMEGRLVAVHASQTVATLDAPCPGATWQLVPHPSPSGS